MTKPSTELALVGATALPAHPSTVGDVLFDREVFAHLRDVAQVLADSQMIPSHFRGKWQDVLLGCALAKTLGENPLILLQGLHVIQGRVGFSAQFMIARVNASGKLRGPIRYRETGEGDSLAVTATATLADSGEDVSITVSVQMAKAEGWYGKNPKWRNLPQLMCRYRAAAFLIRTHFPEVLLGYHEVNELLDSSKRPAEAEYEDPPHASPPSSSSSSTPPGRGRAALSSGGSSLQAAASEDDGPLLALSQHASPSVVARAGESANLSEALPSAEAGDEPSVPAAGWTPAQQPTPSPSARAPGQEVSGSSAGPVLDGTPSPASSQVASPTLETPPAAQEVGPAPKRITRAKLAREQAEEQRKNETDEQKAERQKRHHATWKDGYKRFASDLAAAQVPEADIDTVSAWCDYRSERHNKRVFRPSQRSPEGRRELLDLLKSEAGRAAFLGWADELVDVPVPAVAPTTPQVFASPDIAITWGMDKGAFGSVEEAREAYDQARREGQPANAHEMASMWVAEVTGRLQSREVNRG